MENPVTERSITDPYRFRVLRPQSARSLLWLACFASTVGVAPAQWTEVVLHRFYGGNDGRNPNAGLIRDSAGNLYGTTAGGGSSPGIVYRIDDSRHETVLYSFKGGTDGAFPFGGVIRDSAGNLYGTTYQGGAAYAGVVYKLDSSGNETVLHTFSFNGGTDGGNPYAGVIRDPAGNLYGTTYYGGVWGAGVVYKVDSAGNETVLYSFTGGADGGNPQAGVIR